MSSNFCPSCGTARGPAASFCNACGFRLDSEFVPPPPDGAGSDADFQAKFTSCLSGKGFEALAEAFQSKQAALDFLTSITPEMIKEVEELVAHLTLGLAGHAGITAADAAGATSTLSATEMADAMVYSLGFALGEEAKYVALAALTPEMLSALPALLVAVYEQGGSAASVVHALFDCSINAGVEAINFPYALEVENTLRHFDPPQPPPPAPPPPQLPVAIAPQPFLPPYAPADPPSPTPRSNRGGKTIGGVLGGLTAGAGAIGVVLVMLNSQPGTDATVYDPTPAGRVDVTQMHATTCSLTVHGGYVYEHNCTGSVTLAISENISSGYVSVMMQWPYGELHGYAPVPSGYRGLITVQTHDQYIGQGCTAYPNYSTTVYVYDGIVSSGAVTPQVGKANFTVNYSCT